MRKKIWIVGILMFLFMGNTLSAFASEDSLLVEDEKTSSEVNVVKENLERIVPGEVIKTATRSNGLASNKTIVKNGVVGTVSWTLDDAGVLTFGGGTFPNDYGWYNLREQVKDDTKIVNFTEPINAGNSLYQMFLTYDKLTSVNGLENLDTSRVTNMGFMFSNCPSLTTLDLTSLDTSNVIFMWFMFSGSKSLTTLDLSNFDTSKVTKMSSMFQSCSGLKELNLRGVSIGAATDIDSMFANCPSLTKLDLSSFDTSNVTNMNKIFNATPIEELTLGANFRFKFANHALNTPLTNDKYTGNWEFVPTKETLTQGQFLTYDGTKPGKYVWQRVAYNIIYDSNGGGLVSGQVVPNGSEAVEPTNPTKAGYIFDGWYKEEGLINKWDFTTDLMPANDITLYAKWKAQEYQITYNLDGGTNSSNNPLTYEFAVGVAKFEDPTKEGYKFLGWFESANGGVKITSITDTEMGDKTLFARWEKAEITGKAGTVNKYNKKGTSTGDAANLLGIGAILFASGWYVVDKRKRRQNND